MKNMPTRVLGRTGLQVGVIGLGTEYLFNKDRKTVVETIREAVDRGVNFFDVLGPFPEYRDNMGAAFRGLHDRAIKTCHLGGTTQNGQWATTRDPALCEEYFEDYLRRLGTDYVDVLNITVVDSVNDLDRIMEPGGIMDLARRLVEQGKARFLSMSGHQPEAAMKAIESGAFDVLIRGCNLTWPLDEQGSKCAENNIGLVAMKPYAGGELFYPPYSEFVTPVLALSYVLDQPGVCTVIPGAGDLAQLRDALRFVEASDAERDYRPIMANFSERIWGTCIYCSHCLPCTSGIPIDGVMLAYRAALRGVSYADSLIAGVAKAPAKCVKCGECRARCPFGVDIPAEMKKAGRLFDERKC
jgi:predicted aldo/keto reductase-like oxidoreductase